MGRIEPKIIGVAVAAVGMIGVGLTGCSSGGGISVTGNCAIVYTLLVPSGSGMKSFPTQAAAESYSAAIDPSDPESPIPAASIILKATSGGTVNTVNIEYFGASGQIQHAPHQEPSPFALSAGQTYKSNTNGGFDDPAAPVGATSCKVVGIN